MTGTKIGAVLSGDEVNDRAPWPHGTVLVSLTSGVVYMRRGDEWVSSDTSERQPRYAYPRSTFAVRHLPLIVTPLTVGDEVRGVAAYKALPQDAVVRDSNGTTLRRTLDGFVSVNGVRYGPYDFYEPRKLVSLPDPETPGGAVSRAVDFASATTDKERIAILTRGLE